MVQLSCFRLLFSVAIATKSRPTTRIRRRSSKSSTQSRRLKTLLDVTRAHPDLRVIGNEDQVCISRGENQTRGIPATDVHRLCPVPRSLCHGPNSTQKPRYQGSYVRKGIASLAVDSVPTFEVGISSAVSLDHLCLATRTVHMTPPPTHSSSITGKPALDFDSLRRLKLFGNLLLKTAPMSFPVQNVPCLRSDVQKG
ncbi:hypothetical protein IWX50DRAFT_3097 [Phyllosticta citricarpa]